MSHMTGGAGDVQAMTPEVKEMADTVRPFVQKQKGVEFEKYEPVGYRTQVVAGTNYFVKVHTSHSGGESTLLLRIFKALPHAGGDVQLAGVKDIGKDDAIEHF